METTNEKVEYKKTLNLPQTTLGMRANAPIYQDLLNTFGDTNVAVMNIGDSNVRARRIIDGTHEGRNILKVLKSKGFF